MSRTSCHLEIIQCFSDLDTIALNLHQPDVPQDYPGLFVPGAHGRTNNDLDNIYKLMRIRYIKSTGIQLLQIKTFTI